MQGYTSGMREDAMKSIRLTNDDYKGCVEHVRPLTGRGAQADVYSYQGCAYKVYKPAYKVEWFEFEKAQQSAVNETGLCDIRYYDTTDPYIVKMDLKTGDTLEKKD